MVCASRNNSSDEARKLESLYTSSHHYWLKVVPRELISWHLYLLASGKSPRRLEADPGHWKVPTATEDGVRGTRVGH